MNVQPSQTEQENIKFFADFLSRQQLTDQKSFCLNVDAFRQQHPQAAQDVIKNPTTYYRLIKNFLEKSLSAEENRKRYQAKIDHFNISFDGNLGSNFVSPRGLGSRMANELVGIQGIITKMDVVRSQLEKSVHWCEKTKDYEAKQYPDSFNPEKDVDLNKTKFILIYDENNNPLEFEYGLSSFRDIQSVVIQELPEMAPPGLLPQSVKVILQDTLVNSVKPGDRVQMIGIYKLVTGFQSKDKGIFKPYFLCLSVKPLQQAIIHSKLSSKIPCRQEQLFGLFSRSIAPSVFGHEYLKKAVLLMLLGGVEKNLENKTHLRGDVNILMVGDPGTAKSQILRWVLSTADLAVGTTGSNASGVGLTAAIISDKETGQKTLQAGAMVLADRGVVCIDEFDKMNQNDRVAVHEVMQQQTVTIAKAGMHCSLNARCSVIAAANPIYGQYQKRLPPTKNIGMPDSLLSRFDLIFVILDQKNAEKDKRVSQRVCRNHRLAPTTAETFNQLNEEDDYIINPIDNQKQEENIFEKSNVFKNDSKNEILTQGFLKKYINFCKTNYAPIATDQAIQLTSEMWSYLRQRDFDQRETTHTKVLPMTIRSLETLMRLSCAHAKLRQSFDVEVKDCIQAFKLMVYCLEGDQNALNEPLNEMLRSLNFDSRKDMKPETAKRSGKTAKTTKSSRQEKHKEEEEDLNLKISKIDIGKEDREAEEVLKKAVTKSQMSKVYKALAELKNKKKSGESFVTFKELRDRLSAQKMGDKELESILHRLAEEGKLNFEDNKRIWIS